MNETYRYGPGNTITDEIGFYRGWVENYTAMLAEPTSHARRDSVRRALEIAEQKLVILVLEKLERSRGQ